MSVSRVRRARLLAACMTASALLLTGCSWSGQDADSHAHHDHEHHDDHDVHGNHNLTPPDDQEPSQAPKGPEPTAVRIPDIAVDSSLLHLGVDADGAAEVPDDYDRASWYVEGGRPGDGLPTVLLGHVDSVDGPGVFERLDELSTGSRIEVEGDQGDVSVYEVVDVQVHPKDEFPTFEVFGNVDEDVLRLVTCTGDFDPDEREYSDNMIVFADSAQE